MDIGAKSIYDSFGREIYGEDSDKYWVKKQYDSDGNVIYFEDSRWVLEEIRIRFRRQRNIL
jgi:hypothetical protein